MGESTIQKQDEIQIQCMKDWALFGVIGYDKSNNTYMMQCPTCYNTFAVVPLEPDNEPSAPAPKTEKNTGKKTSK
jgi:hypothetical protein